MTDSTQELLAAIEERLGPSSGYTRLPVYGRDHSKTIADLQRWVTLKGVVEGKVMRCSVQTLCNAYRIGEPYLAKMREPDPPRPKTSWRKVSTTGALDLESLEKSAQDQKVLDLLNQRMDSLVSTALEVPEPSSAPTLDADSIERVLNQLIPARLRAAEKSLSDHVARQIQGVESTTLAHVNRRWIEALVAFDEKTAMLVENCRADIRALAEKSIPRIIEIRVPHRDPKLLDFEPRHVAFDEILRWLLAGENVYVVGPAGTGKTHLFKQIGAALDKTVFLPGQALTKYDVSGFRGPTGEYFGTVVREALETGGLLCIDEGDMWAATALAFLNAPLANGWCSFPDKTIQVHPEFQCIVAANTYGHGATQEYIGRNPLDAASLDRFATVYVDYDEDLERLLFGSGPWTTYVHRIRAAVRELGLQSVVSMRALARISRGLAANLTVEQILSASIWRGMEPDTIDRIKEIAGEPPEALIIESLGASRG